MTTITETAAEYRAREAINCGFLTDIIAECPAYAWAWSDMNPNRLPEKKSKEFDIGTAAHLAVLEPDEFEGRVAIVPFDSYRTKEAQSQRGLAYAHDRVPLLPDQLALVHRLHDAITESPLGVWFDEGKREQSYAWDFDGLPCKARVDCVSAAPPWLDDGKYEKAYDWDDEPRGPVNSAVPFDGGPLLDLKSYASAGPDFFQRACLRDHLHVRAAWYIDGWMEAFGERRPYVFAVVAKAEPHLVACYTLDERAIEWGRRLYRRALGEVRLGLDTGKWRGYDAGEDKVNTISLPTFLEHRLAEMFAEEDAPA